MRRRLIPLAQRPRIACDGQGHLGSDQPRQRGAHTLRPLRTHGLYLGELVLPQRTERFALAGDILVAVTPDEDDVAHLTSWRISTAR